MSRENVEIARQASGRRSQREASRQRFPTTRRNAICEDMPELPDGAVYQGRRGVPKRDRHWRDMWRDMVLTPVEFIDAGEDAAVVVVYAARSWTRERCPESETTAALAYEVQDGLAVRDRGALHVAEPGPRSRRAVGVGDVAGERRGFSTGPSTPARRRDLDAFLALYDPWWEFISYWLKVEGGGYIAANDGVRDWWKRLLDAYPDLQQRSRTYRTSATALSRGCCGTAMAAVSDVPMSQTMWLVAKVLPERAIGWHYVSTEAEALKVADD